MNPFSPKKLKAAPLPSLTQNKVRGDHALPGKQGSGGKGVSR